MPVKPGTTCQAVAISGNGGGRGDFRLVWHSIACLACGTAPPRNGVPTACYAGGRKRAAPARPVASSGRVVSGKGRVMRYRSLGDSGLLVSVAGLGGNNFGGRLDLQQTRAVVDAALDAGITLLDTADIYGNGGGSEEMLGEILAGRRDQVVLATKFGHQRADLGYGPAAGAKGGRAYIRRAVEASLRRLRTDYLDLYQLHTPDPATPVAETLRALTELVAEGKVRYIGHSNFTGWQIADAAHLAAEAGTEAFISAQNHWSLLERQAEAEVVPAARHFGLGMLPYYPLANGLLTGKVRRGQAPPAGTRLAARAGLRDRRQTGPGRGAGRVGRRARRQPAGRGHRGPRRPAGMRLGDRRRHVPGPGQGERRGGRMDPVRPPSSPSWTASSRRPARRPEHGPARWRRGSAAGHGLVVQRSHLLAEPG